MIELTPKQIDLCRLLAYDRASHSRLFHRTGETVSEPLFEDWIKLANTFRDAERIAVTLKPQAAERQAQ